MVGNIVVVSKALPLHLGYLLSSRSNGLVDLQLQIGVLGLRCFGFEAVALVEHLPAKQHTSGSRGSLLSVSSLVIVVSTNHLGQEKFISN